MDEQKTTDLHFINIKFIRLCANRDNAKRKQNSKQRNERYYFFHSYYLHSYSMYTGGTHPSAEVGRTTHTTLLRFLRSVTGRATDMIAATVSAGTV